MLTSLKTTLFLLAILFLFFSSIYGIKKYLWKFSRKDRKNTFTLIFLYTGLILSFVFILLTYIILNTYTFNSLVFIMVYVFTGTIFSMYLGRFLQNNYSFLSEKNLFFYTFVWCSKVFTFSIIIYFFVWQVLKRFISNLNERSFYYLALCTYLLALLISIFSMIKFLKNTKKDVKSSLNLTFSKNFFSNVNIIIKHIHPPIFLSLGFLSTIFVLNIFLDLFIKEYQQIFSLILFGFWFFGHFFYFKSNEKIKPNSFIYFLKKTGVFIYYFTTFINLIIYMIIILPFKLFSKFITSIFLTITIGFKQKNFYCLNSDCYRISSRWKAIYKKSLRYCEHCKMQIKTDEEINKIAFIFGQELDYEMDAFYFTNPDLSIQKSPIDVSEIYIDTFYADVDLLNKFITYITQHPPVWGLKEVYIYIRGDLKALDANIENQFKNTFKYFESYEK